MHTNSFGSMDGTYFVSRGELLQWLSQTFKTQVSRIEDLSTGAVYCQIFDECMPNKLQMSKVNWNAKQEYECINNLKLLQQGFTRCNIKKNIEIEKLVKGKCQDNLEMLQWMKRFFDCNSTGVARGKSNPSPINRSRVLAERNSAEKVRKSVEKKNEGDVKVIVDNSKIAIDSLQKERDFYFEKLREIEVRLQQFEDKEHPLVKSILSILYLEEV